MSSTGPSVTPYLNFSGNAAEAMKFYHGILGGELTMQTFAEADMSKSPQDKDRIVHAALKNEALLSWPATRSRASRRSSATTST